MKGIRYAVEYVNSTDRPSCGTLLSLYFFVGIGIRLVAKKETENRDRASGVLIGLFDVLGRVGQPCF